MISKEKIEDMEKIIKEFIQTKLMSGEEKHNLTNTDNLIESGIVDSLGIMKLVDFIENTFSIEIGENDLTAENFETIELISKFIVAIQESKA